MNELSRPIPSPWCSETSLQGPTAPPGQPGLPIRPGSNTAWAAKYSLLPSSPQGECTLSALVAPFPLQPLITPGHGDLFLALPLPLCHPQCSPVHGLLSPRSPGPDDMLK